MLNIMRRFFPQPVLFPVARRRCDLVIVSAASDGEWLGVEDMLDSLATYLDCSYEVVIADDATTDGTYERLLDAGCWVVRNPEKLYLFGLDLTLRRAFSEASRLFDARVYLKIDPDALVIGRGLPDALLGAFSVDPRIGLLGTFRTDWNGEPRDLSHWADRMRRRTSDLGEPLVHALKNGYVLGEGVQGGAYALSRACLDSIVNRGWLHGGGQYRPGLVKGHQVAEDSLITMLTYAAGFRAVDIGGPGQPFGLWDIGLPMSPEELVQQNRLVTHAIKYREESAIAQRDFFRNRRNAFRQTGKQ
jgi:hypothetical protein